MTLGVYSSRSSGYFLSCIFISSFEHFSTFLLSPSPCAPPLFTPISASRSQKQLTYRIHRWDVREYFSSVIIFCQIYDASLAFFLFPSLIQYVRSGTISSCLRGKSDSCLPVRACVHVFAFGSACGCVCVAYKHAHLPLGSAMLLCVCVSYFRAMCASFW